MDSADSIQVRSLGDYVGLCRRQWTVLVVALALGAVVGIGLLAVLPKSYSASSSVLVKAITDPGEATEAADARTTGTINMDTESQVVKSLPVAAAVKQAIESPLTPVELASRVSVSIPANTTIISIAFEADTASEAHQGAAAFATAYLQNRASVAQDRVDQQIRQLDNEAAETDDQIKILIRKLPGLAAGSSERLSVEQDLRGLRSRSNWIDDQLLPLQTAQTAPGTIIVAAQRPTAPASPNRILVLGSALALTLLLGLTGALWRDRHQGRIRLASEVESELSLEILGTVQDPGAREPGEPPMLAGNRRISQEFRQVVHAIQARISGQEPTVLVTGVGVTSVAQEVAHTLGTAVARTGTDVTLVYSDEATVATYSRELEVGARSGRGRRASLETTSLEAADLLIDGDVQNRALPQFLEGLREDDRLVLLSTPPTERSADAQAVSPSVRLTVLVVELNRTTQQDVARALRQLHQVGVEEVSAIVVATRRNRPKRRRSKRAEEITPAAEFLSSERAGDAKTGTQDARSTDTTEADTSQSLSTRGAT